MGTGNISVSLSCRTSRGFAAVGWPGRDVTGLRREGTNSQPARLWILGIWILGLCFKCQGEALVLFTWVFGDVG